MVLILICLSRFVDQVRIVKPKDLGGLGTNARVETTDKSKANDALMML